MLTENKNIKGIPNSCSKLYGHVQLCYVWPEVCETEDNVNGKNLGILYVEINLFFFFSATSLKLLIFLSTNYLEKIESPN